MNEIKHPLKQQFLLLVENDALLVWYKPKDLWARFEKSSQTRKRQTYSLINQLEKFGYIKKFYDQAGNLYYSETDKLTEFRTIHCTEKATSILTEQLRLINQIKVEKDMEIQLTKELSKKIPEINFCLKNHIDDNKKIITHLNNQKNNITNILKKIESYIF